MTDDNKRANIAAELDAARRAYEAAVRNAAAGDLETAANRLYYSGMHAAKALCLAEGLEPKSHRGLKRLVSARFVAEGALPAWVEQAFSQLETERDLADYATGYRVTAARYEERRSAAEQLLAEIERALKAAGRLR